MNNVPNPLLLPGNHFNERDGKIFYSAGSISSNAKANKARAKGALKGDLAYTEQQAHVSLEEGWVEDNRTVAHKLKSKEEFPQG